jgi:hypothetical protein
MSGIPPENAAMGYTTPPHKFAVGEEVEVSISPLERNLPQGTHVITRTLPGDDFDRTYRARSKQDGVERVFREPQLKPGPSRI